MPCDKWHMTRDMQHVTCDMLWGVNILSKFQLPSSSGFWFMIFWRLGGKGWVTEFMSNESDCRTALATPGLLNIVNQKKIYGPQQNFYNSHFLQIWKWHKIVWDVGILQKVFFCLCIPRWLDRLGKGPRKDWYPCVKLSWYIALQGSTKEPLLQVKLGQTLNLRLFGVCFWQK